MNAETMLCEVACEVAGVAPVPDVIQLSPWGKVQAKNGDFVVDQAGADTVVAAFNAHGVDLPIDWEHATLGGEFAAPDGRAPAAGFVKEIIVRPGDGIYARVQWNADGGGDVAGRRYRYISPVFMVDRKTGQVRELHSVALTNKPAIPNLKPIAASERRPTGATDVDKHEALLKRLRPIIKAGDEAGEETVVKALSERVENPPVDLTKWVSRADFERIVSELQRERETGRGVRVAAFCDRGMNEGKISNATRSEWERQFHMDPDKAELALKDAPELFPKPGRIVMPMHSGSTDRPGLIARACREFDGQERLQQLTTRAAFINNALREAGRERLSAGEAEKLR